jgi:predicted RNase H-like HicB family nuclease
MLVKIEIYPDGEFWCARGLDHDIFTQAKTLDELHANIREAVSVHFGSKRSPITILTISDEQLVNTRAAAS